MTPPVGDTATSPSTGDSAASPGVVLGRMETELRELWRPSSPSEPPKTRACTMNLVLVSDTARAAQHVAAVDVVVQSVPARAIVVALDRDAKGRFDGEVSAVCAMFDKKVVCSERLTLTVDPTIPARVASAVYTLLVPEMPTAVVWPDAVSVDDPLLAVLSEGAHRVIVDSARTGALATAQIAGRCESLDARPCLADLAWTRLALWQELCCRFFDSPYLARAACGVSKIVLRQARRGDAGTLRAEAALFIAWLATRLGWSGEVLPGAKAIRLVRADKKPVTLEIEEDEGESALSAVRIEAQHEGVSLRGSVAITREAGESGGPALAWRLDVEGGRPREQLVRLRGTDPARSSSGRSTVRRGTRPSRSPSPSCASTRRIGDMVVCPHLTETR